MKTKCALPVVLTLLLLFSSCQSLPLPDTPEKSLLIIPCSFALGTNTDGARLVSVTVKLTPTSDVASGKVRILSLPIGKPYGAFAMDPGSYVFSSVTLTHGWYQGGRQWNTWADTQYVGSGVYLQPQTVLMNRSLFWYADRADPNSGWDYSFSVSALDRGAGILDQIKKDSHWSAWEGYQLVNFTAEE